MHQLSLQKKMYIAHWCLKYKRYSDILKNQITKLLIIKKWFVGALMRFNEIDSHKHALTEIES